MKKTCLLLSIVSIALISLSARPAQAQTPAEAPSILPPTVTTEIAPGTAEPAVTQLPRQTIAQREISQTAPTAVEQPVAKPASFVRVPMVSRIFPSMWQ
jgi:hypothetical protein